MKLPPSDETPKHTWPLRLAAVAPTLVRLVPPANFLSEEGRLDWWRDAVHHWLLWSPMVLLLAFLLARIAPRGVDGLIALGRRALLEPRPWTFALACAGVTIVLSLYF